MNHCSLDLETLGSGPHAAVVAIGAVMFDPLTGELGKEFYSPITAESAVGIGGRIEPSTVLWWMSQADEARNELIFANINARDALRYFTGFLPSEAFVWGNGSGFDNARLREAYLDADLPCPFHFRNDMDLRTIREVTGIVGDLKACAVERVGTHHNALHDAIFQAKLICAYFRELRRIKGESE